MAFSKSPHAFGTLDWEVWIRLIVSPHLSQHGQRLKLPDKLMQAGLLLPELMLTPFPLKKMCCPFSHLFQAVRLKGGPQVYATPHPSTKNERFSTDRTATVSERENPIAVEFTIASPLSR
jgi:hypothetical protein